MTHHNGIRCIHKPHTKDHLPAQEVLCKFDGRRGVSFDIEKPRNRFGYVDKTVGNYPSRDSCTQASAVATTVCGIIHATLCKRKWHWAWICRLAPPTLSTSSIVQVPFLILLYIVTEKRRVAQKIIRLMWLFLKEARAAITHPPRAHLKRHEPSILSLSYLSPVVNVVLEKAGLSVEICVRFPRASWQYNHSFNKTAYWCN